MATGNTINDRLGLRAKTRPREATHGFALASSVHCVACGCRHCCRSLSENGKRLGSHWCGGCSAFFTPAP